MKSLAAIGYFLAAGCSHATEPAPLVCRYEIIIGEPLPAIAVDSTCKKKASTRILVDSAYAIGIPNASGSAR